MKQAVIIEMSTEDLLGSLSEVRATLAKLNLAHAVSPLENPVIIRETKKTVAPPQEDRSKTDQKPAQPLLSYPFA